MNAEIRISREVPLINTNHARSFCVRFFCAELNRTLALNGTYFKNLVREPNFWVFVF